MPAVTIKDFPPELHAQLKKEAEVNFRSLNQEVLARLQRTLEVDAALDAKRDQKWIDEALASGPIAALTNEEMDSVRDRVLKKKKR
jgi:hypothetical protein